MSSQPTPPVPGTATAIQLSSSPPPTKFHHPLDPLTTDEISAISSTILKSMVGKHGTDGFAVKFVTCMLQPPPKRAVLAHLGIPLAPGAEPEPPTPIARRADVDFFDVLRGLAYNAVLELDKGTWSIQKLTLLPEGVQPQITVEELIECEDIVRNDKTVQRLAAEVGVLPHQICCDGWSIGYDARFPQAQRIQQAFVFARLTEHDNLYAHPLDFIPILDSNNKKVLHIEFAPHYTKNPNGDSILSAPNTKPPKLGTLEEALTASGRQRIPPPRTPYEFLPDLIDKIEKGGYEPRKGLKPLNISQPEGVSFKLDGHVLEWQGWKMHVAYSHREGIALSTITYTDQGELRPLFYRLSLAEMVVPYGAPEHPHPRKFAFDSGEYGMGTMANELSLGCDCLGSIQYLPGSYISNSGQPVIIKNVICIHEEDAGVLWKHTDYRVGGRSHTVRRRRLVVSMVCTLANYEYIWNYFFYQDGSIEFEIRLTGILQVYIGKDGETNPHGTTVAPNIMAHYHQHLFSLRIDPMIDGLSNSVIESDVIPEDAPTGSDANYAGNGFTTRDTVLQTECERKWEYATDRRWRIVNRGRRHYSSGKEGGYVVVMKAGAVPMMAREDGWVGRRAAFARSAVWVCRDVEGGGAGEEKGTVRMWPAGKYVPQTREEPEESVGRWVKGGKGVDGEDILMFVTIGTTHIPRPEDWPVMPVENLSVFLKPTSFFTKNPSMDVPGVVANDGHSVLVDSAAGCGCN